ncbi:MAG: hypothetical protein K2X46_02395 [Roseomonas sp.]|nr:hypothetical protein [Roseomonas sp.]
MTALTVSLALMGCQTEPVGTGGGLVTSMPVGTSRPGAEAVAFRCPEAGTRVIFGVGGTLLYHGADPADPTICLRAGSDGVRQRMLYNFYQLPLTDERSVRQGLQRLWPLAVNKSVDYIFIGQTDSMSTHQYAENFRVLRAEVLMIDGSPRNTLVLRHTQEGRLDNRFLGSSTYWWDTATGAWLKREVSVTRGQSSSRPYEAIGITVPSLRR